MVLQGRDDYIRRMQASLDLEENKQEAEGGKMEEEVEENRGKALRLAEARSKFQSLLLNTIRLEGDKRKIT